jgi:hypothetical protein
MTGSSFRLLNLFKALIIKITIKFKINTNVTFTVGLTSFNHYRSSSGAQILCLQVLKHEPA